MNNSVRLSLAAAIGFGAGLAAGYLAAKGGRELVKTAVHELDRARSGLSSMQGSLKALCSNALSDISDFVKKNLSDPIPDLYRALDSFDIGEDDLTGE
jgi:hypothetical protein